MTANWFALGTLLLWGTVVGVDLVSFPQALLSRPLVACAGAGFLLGDPVSGFRVGVVLELFALDVLPVGAARYPDYGPAAVGAVLLAGGGPWMVTLGLATLYTLLLAGVGGWSLQVLRRANGRALQRNAAGLAAGQAGTVSALLAGGIAGDVVRSCAMTGVSLAVALVGRAWLPNTGRFGLVTAVAVGCAIAAAAHGALRSAGTGPRLRWLVGGCVVGGVWVALP